jgi:hypothetical protein
MSAGRIILLVFGIIVVLISFGLLLGGGVILVFDSSFRDAEGFYTTDMIPVVADSSAVITRPADFQIDPVGFWRQGNLVTLRVKAVNSDSARPIFIGVARTADLDRYLSGVSYDEFTGFTPRSSRIDLMHVSGNALPAAPASQSFWVASDSGTGERQLLWNVTSGSYSLVLMNVDGSAPVDADVSLGARVPGLVHNVGLGLLIAGIIVLIIGGVMIFFAVKSPPKPPAVSANPAA